MDKIEVITKHPLGMPDKKTGITWIEFLQDFEIENEQQMYDIALNLLRGHFFYNGTHVYFLTGINMR